jgi:hypothetical protein
MEQIIVLLVDLGQNLVSTPLLVAKLETPTPFWAIFNALAHLITTPTWERLVVLDQI